MTPAVMDDAGFGDAPPAGAVARRARPRPPRSCSAWRRRCVAVVATGMLVERTFRANPARLLPVMLRRFIAKMMFFDDLRRRDAEGSRAPAAAPFVVSFVVYFMALYAVQAVLLRTPVVAAPGAAPGNRFHSSCPSRPILAAADVQRRRGHHRARLEQLARPSADPSAADLRHRLLGHQARVHAVARRRAGVRRRHGDRAALPARSRQLVPTGSDERARGGRRVRPRRRRAAERRRQVGCTTWTPLLLTLFVFILGANVDRPDPDLRRARAGRSLRAAHGRAFVPASAVIHGGSTATGNFNVTAGLATVSVLRDHRRRHAGARVRQALEEPGAARRAAGRSIRC